MTKNVIFDILDACSIRWNQFCSIFNNFKNFFTKIPMKYSKNGQKFAMSKNPSNMLINTCWSHAKKTGCLHVTSTYASSSLLVSDNSFPQQLQVSDSSSKLGSRVTFQLGVPSRMCFQTPCMDGSNAL